MLALKFSTYETHVTVNFEIIRKFARHQHSEREVVGLANRMRFIVTVFRLILFTFATSANVLAYMKFKISSVA